MFEHTFVIVVMKWIVFSISLMCCVVCAITRPRDYEREKHSGITHPYGDGEREAMKRRERGRRVKAQLITAAEISKVSELASFFVVTDVSLSIAGVLARPIVLSDVRDGRVRDVHAATLTAGQVSF